MTTNNRVGERPLRKPWRVDGKRLRSARDKKKWRQIDLTFDSGVDVGTISRLESGQPINLTLDKLGALCDSLAVSSDWLCGKSRRQTRS